MKTLLDYINEDLFDIDNYDDIIIGKEIQWYGQIQNIKNNVCTIAPKDPTRNIQIGRAGIDQLVKIKKMFKIKTFRFMTPTNAKYVGTWGLIIEGTLVGNKSVDFQGLNIEAESCMIELASKENTFKNLNLKCGMLYYEWGINGRSKSDIYFEDCNIEANSLEFEETGIPLFIRGNQKFKKIICKSKELFVEGEKLFDNVHHTLDKNLNIFHVLQMGNHIDCDDVFIKGSNQNFIHLFKSGGKNYLGDTDWQYDVRGVNIAI